MKNRVIILTIICFSRICADARGPLVPLYIQPYVGVSGFVFKDGSVTSLQTGIIYTFFDGVLFMGLENNFSYLSRTYEWPGIEKYRYVRTYNNLGLLIGLRVLRLHRFNFAVGTKLYRQNVNGIYKTKNEVIKSYVKNYHIFSIGVCPGIQMNYRITYRSSIYSNFNLISIKGGGTSILFGLGMAYNFYDR